MGGQILAPYNNGAPRVFEAQTRAEAVQDVAAPVSGIDWQEIGISSAIGSAIFVGLLVLYTLFQRLRDAING